MGIPVRGDDLPGVARTSCRSGSGALAEGISAEVLGEAISLAATRLLLHDRGLTESQATAAGRLAAFMGLR